MRLPFLDRRRELARLEGVLRGSTPGLAVVYGRRRLGKSRLVQRVLEGRRAVYYVGDDRAGALQREALAREVAALLPGFASVRYPDWGALLERFFAEAPPGAVLALDELPALAASSPELPSVLQRVLDARVGPHHVVLAGSSQRMMHGLVLDGSAPLYGRAQESFKVGPLPVGWLREGLGVRGARTAVEAWSAFGGVPRYWELAAGRGGAREAFAGLALDPLGVLHGEPERLLYDELDDAARASSVLALVATGASRASEIAGRMGLPMTTLSRPLARLVDLGLVAREVPFGESPRDAKRSLYRVADPFLRAWFRFVEPNRSRLERGDVALVSRELGARWPQHVAEAWEELARASVPQLRLAGGAWATGERWWGRDRGGAPLELDLIAPCVAEPKRVLVGEVKLTVTEREVDRALTDLRERASRCPILAGKRIDFVLFALDGPRRPRAGVITGDGWWAAVQAARRRE